MMTDSSIQLLSRQRIKEKLGDPRLSDATLYRMVQRGELPQPIRFSKGRIGFIESEVDAKLAERARERADLKRVAA